MHIALAFRSPAQNFTEAFSLKFGSLKSVQLSVKCVAVCGAVLQSMFVTCFIQGAMGTERKKSERDIGRDAEVPRGGTGRGEGGPPPSSRRKAKS